MGIAFGIDMLGYLIASIMFSQIYVSKITTEQGEEIEHESVLESDPGWTSLCVDEC